MPRTADTSLPTVHASESTRDGTHPILRIRGLRVVIDDVAVVEDVSCTIHAQQTVALVGASGCGKSMTALSILGLLPAGGRVDRGQIRFDGRDLDVASPRSMREIRGREVAMIFQEPMSALNPVYRVGEQVVEAVRQGRRIPRRAARRKTLELLEEVRLPRPEIVAGSFPHELSGGMCQRAMIAMALAQEPRLLLADEPTTALDVTVQAEILDLLAELKATRGMAILFITHDLALVADRADVVCVMFAGRIMEYARTAELLARPRHPYTRGLMASAPRLGDRRDRLRGVDEVLARDDAFASFETAVGPREPWWTPRTERPPRLLEVAPDHWVLCVEEDGDEAAPAPDITIPP